MLRTFTFVLLFWVYANAQAELTIEIKQGIASAIPISVVPFALPEGTKVPEDIDGIIRNDLERSGHFKPISPDDMLSHPNNIEDIYFRDWRLLKQDYVLIGQVEARLNDVFQIRYQLFDVFNEKELLSQTLRGTKQQLRDIAHKVSDSVYEQLTGIRGAFSTKIAYVTANRARTNFTLAIADSDGAREQIVLKSKYSIFSPAWSPDGKKLAYVMLEDKGSRVYVQELATGKKRIGFIVKGIEQCASVFP